MKEIIHSTYINPLTDFGFKLIFASEENKALLIDFLNGIIDEEREIADIAYGPTYQLGNTEKDRKAVFDIFCRNEKGESFIVEMQKVRQAYFVDRSLFYSTFPIQRQAPQGEWNFELKAVYTVAILDFTLFKDKEDENEYIERIYLTRERTKKRYSNKLNFIFVELPKFNKTLKDLKTDVDRWIYCLKYFPELEVQPEEIRGEIFNKLFKTAERKKLTNKEMKAYYKSVLEYRDVINAVNFAKEESFEEGMERGMEKGIAKGMEKGMYQRNFEIARKCLQKKMPVPEIAELTGLSPGQIIDLL